MKKTTFIVAGLIISFGLGSYLHAIASKRDNAGIEALGTGIATKHKESMKLGAFSISLSVKDIKASRLFYENLGFTVFGGGMEQNYLIMKNGNSLIGLFQGMFQGNILTFNPGWDENAKNMESFDDVRQIQRLLKSRGVKLTSEADEKTSGPASITTTDPDGNVILIDQHR